MKRQPKAIATVDDLTPDPANANRGTDRGGALLDASLDQVGPARSIFADSQGVVLGGNKTLERWKKRGGKILVVQTTGDQLVVVQRTDLDLVSAPKRAREAATFDNRTSELNLSWDINTLLADAEAGRIELATFFQPTEVSGLVRLDALREAASKPPAELDDAPPLPTKTKIVRGDLFELGRHRILCGDARKDVYVAALMGKTLADMMFTDPPYGVMYGSGKGNEAKMAIRGDLSQATIPISFHLAITLALNKNARIYCCGGNGNYEMYQQLFDVHLHDVPRIAIWNKERFVMRRNHYHSQFEIVYFGWKGAGGGPRFWFGDRKQTDLWSIPTDRDYLHPTQKPVELGARAIRNSCPVGGVVYEPFSGSGSTLVGAEAERRTCYAMDNDRKFVQVTIDRFENLTGTKAKHLGRIDARRKKR